MLLSTLVKLKSDFVSPPKLIGKPLFKKKRAKGEQNYADIQTVHCVLNNQEYVRPPLILKDNFINISNVHDVRNARNIRTARAQDVMNVMGVRDVMAGDKRLLQCLLVQEILRRLFPPMAAH